MTETDTKKSNLEVLKDHEAKIISWANNADAHTLKMAVRTASNHEMFPEFSQGLRDYKFGTHPVDDVIKFDMWLKKMELAKAIPAIPATPVTSTTKPQTIEPEPNKEAYKEYWKKYERKNADPSMASVSTTPSRSPSDSLRQLMRRSTSMMSDGSGDVPMGSLTDRSTDGGKVKRVGAPERVD
eukprot:Skav205823  [mRNA]  locus=scaffold870:20563:21460:- [translate_table: standard]